MRLTVDYVSSRPTGGREATPGLGVSEPGSVLRRRGGQSPLYTLCWLDGAAAGETLPVVSDALHAEFAASAGRSLTSGLLRSVRTAVHTLARENASSLPKHRCDGSVCAAALKEDTLYLAAVGGAAIWVWQDGTVRVACASDSAQGSCDDESEIALGSCRLEPGTAVILASPGLGGTGQEVAFAETLQRVSTVGQIAEALEGFHPSSPADFSAVVLFPADSADEAPRARQEPPPSSTPPLSQTRVTPAVEETPRPRRPEVTSNAAAEGSRAYQATRAKRERAHEEVPPISPAVPSRPRAGSVQGLLLKLSVVLVALAAVAVVLYVGEGYFSAQARMVQAAELLKSLDQKERDALAAPDAASRRWLLTEASRAADRAVAANGADAGVAEAAQRIKARLDDLNGVARLSGYQLLADFAAREKGAQPAQVIGAKDDIYVLDRGLGSVWHVKLGRDLGATGQPNLLWKSQSTVQGVPLNEAMAFFWMHVAAPGIPEQLYVVDSSGALVRVAQGVVGQPIRVPGTGALALVRAAAGQAGNLYVLDSQRRVVWRYTPGPNGYEAAGQEYVTEANVPELANVTDMAMDGSLYFLLSDGRLLKYAGGKAQTFPAVVPDTPLRRPSAIFTSPATRNVYVADSGNARVVQFTKEGQYVRQFRAPNDALDGVTGVFVDEEASRLFALVGARSFVAPLPAAGQR